MRYIIAALPRSRTYWCSVALSTDGELCLHDPLGKVESLDYLPKCAGISDTGAMFFYNELKDRFPEAKWIVIDRPLEEVKISMLAKGWNIDLLEQAAVLLDRIQPVLRVSFDKIDHYRHEIWSACGMKQPLDEARWERLRHRNMQVGGLQDAPLLLEVRRKWLG